MSLFIFSTLNQVFTFVANFLIVAITIAFMIGFMQSIIAKAINDVCPKISDDFHNQVKELMHDIYSPDDENIEPVILSGNMGIREIRQYIRNHNLQTQVRLITGKTYSKCRLAELRIAIA